MKKEQVTRLLDHWRRPVSGSELFRFSRVLQNHKSDETMSALYTDSFAAVLGHEAVSADDGDAAENDFQGVDSTTPVSLSIGVQPSMQHTNPVNDPALQQLPTSNSIPEVPTVNPMPIDESNIHPSLRRQVYPPLPSAAPTPVIRPNENITPVGSRTEPEQSRPPSRSSPTPAADDSNINTAVLGLPEKSRPTPKSRPRPKEKSKNPTTAFQDLTGQQEEGLGRPKRAQKRKLDIYLEAEQRTADLAEKKKNGGKRKK